MRSSESSQRDASTPTSLFASAHTRLLSARAIAARIQQRLPRGSMAARCAAEEEGVEEVRDVARATKTLSCVPELLGKLF